MGARDVARRVLRRVDAEKAYATLALNAELEDAALGERDRRLATELVYGVLRHRSRLDRALDAMAHRGLRKLAPGIRVALRVAAYQILFLDRVPAHAAVDDAVAAVRRVGGKRMAGFANGLLRRLAREGEPRLPDPAADLRRHIEVTHSLPGWIVERIERGVGAEELDEAAAALSVPPQLVARVNRLRSTRAAVAERLRAEGAETRESPHSADALFVTGLGDPDRSASFGEGLWTVQDLGAQLVTRLVTALSDPPLGEGSRLLDACAGLGGKSTYLAELTGDRARIDAVDVSGRKLALGEQAARRLGIESLRGIELDLLDAELPAEYDAALLDAPCTGLGVLRRHPEAKWRLEESDVAEMADLQRRLLDVVAARVRPGGALVYAVCSFTEEEGARQISSFLDRWPDYAPAHAAGAQAELRTWPHREEADAFYAVRLERLA